MRRFNLSIMDSYILGELILPFIFCVAMFSAVGVAIATLSDLSHRIIESNLPFISAIEVFILKIPEYVGYALPFSVLLTSLLTYSRLSKDSELIALQSCGISLYRLITPMIIFSMIITLVTFTFNELIIPQANYRATSILTGDEGNSRYAIKQDIFYPQYQEVTTPNGEVKRELRSIFYAQEFNGEEMQNITVIETDNNQLEKITVSETGHWDNEDNKWDFSNGAIYHIKMNLSQITSSFFGEKKVPLPKTPLELASKSRSPYEMNIRESLEYIRLLEEVGNEKNLLMYQVRTAQKVSFPFICVIFGLIGSTVGAKFNSNNKGTSFGLTILIVFGYYLTSFIIGSLGLINVLSPIMAAWIPNFICLGIGIYLLAKS
ncbi:permease YjgP/YjgQ family protein [Cyanobacterium stanieri PCC 7202]|uniref:Permease YjgP/YjgQ family protein n=1 Tax=Cyanobacterium stanieri (strain ATCC 29140 / PCC 7202) TaxID=292563 RepID=K9YN34_CYASC|nr:permease YjgP/YjgQ family protein [Cyanobacterium stanieri PCC 7202]